MTALELLELLAFHPNGIQITMHPGRVTIDCGYGERQRYEGRTLDEVVKIAAHEQFMEV